MGDAYFMYTKKIISFIKSNRNFDSFRIIILINNRFNEILPNYIDLAFSIYYIFLSKFLYACIMSKKYCMIITFYIILGRYLS